MVYDLNRICDDVSKGRDISVPGGENFDSLILHKAIVGGDPADPKDREHYPGCVLVNLPRLKVHAQALFTNVIKNLGIGLYPMQVTRSGGCAWEYATPQRKIPGMKGAIPHQVWVPEMDPVTCLPRRTENGYVVRKTGGLTGTMLDIIAAVANQDIFMVHIVDAIEGINRDHQGQGVGIREPEGLVVAGLDPVAADLFLRSLHVQQCGNERGRKRRVSTMGWAGASPKPFRFPDMIATVIATEKGYDCPLRRDHCFERAERRGLRKTFYHVVGHDAITGHSLASFRGRLGYTNGNVFEEIVTKALYSDTYKMPWDLQQTFWGTWKPQMRWRARRGNNCFLLLSTKQGTARLLTRNTGRKVFTGRQTFWVDSI